MLNKKFIQILLILNLFLLFVPILKADTPRNIYTPNGTLVGDSYTRSESSFIWRLTTDIIFLVTYPNAIQIELWGDNYSSSTRYNCHGYAWHMIGDNAINDPVWIGYYYPGATYKYWQDGSYYEVPGIPQKNGSMVDYSGDHSAVRTSQTDYYISKWGACPLMRHHKDYHPGYGNPQKFYQKSFQAKISTNIDKIEYLSEIPVNFTLYPNNPNPFNPITTISFGLPESGAANISVYTITGQKVKTLLDEQLSAGFHQLQWDGTDQYGNKVTSGVYLYHLNAISNDGQNVYSEKRKMILMK